MTTEDFLSICAALALAMIIVGLGVSVYRLVKGPTLADRVVALDLATLLVVGFIGVVAVLSGVYAFLDVAIGLALVGFLATVAFARYVFRASKVASNAGASGSTAGGSDA